LVVAACNRPAAELPPDYGSVQARQTASLAEFSADEQKLSCPEVDDRRRAVKAEADALTAKITSNRGNNQTAGYIGGVLFPPVLFALELNEGEKKSLDSLQARDDHLIKLKSLKRCKRADR
jgi:hypothetical protein